MRSIEWLCWVTFQTTPIYAFFVAFHIFIVGDRSQLQPTDDKTSTKYVWLCQVTHFNHLMVC